MCRRVLVKPMFYGSAFCFWKIEKQKRFPWIIHRINLPEWHLTLNSMVYTSYSVYPTPVISGCVGESLWIPCFTAQHFVFGRSKNTKDSLELSIKLCSRSGIWRKIPWYVPPLLSLSDVHVFRMCRRVLVKPMFYGSALPWRKIEKHKRFPWIIHRIMLPEWHLTVNSMVCTSATQFIRRPCFPDV